MHARALGDLVDGVARPVDGEADQVQVLRRTARTAARLSRSLPVAKRSAVKTDRARPRLTARSCAAASTSLLPAKTSTGCRNIGRYPVPSASAYGSPITSGDPLPDPAHEERGHVKPLPDFQVVAQHDGDLGVEPDRLAARGRVSRIRRRIHGKPSNTAARRPVLYDFCVADDPRIRAWRPPVPGVAEVLHAHMTSHVYPMHTHEAWTLLIVDDGMIRYDLHRHEHGALHQAVTLLPPRVPHNGRAATSSGFRKRVVYLDLSHLPASLIGQAVDQPVLFDPLAAPADQPAAPRARRARR